MYSHLKELEERVKFWEKAVETQTNIIDYHTERMQCHIQRRDFKEANLSAERLENANRVLQLRMVDLRHARENLQREQERLQHARERRQSQSHAWECHDCHRSFTEVGAIYIVDGKVMCSSCNSKYTPLEKQCANCSRKIPTGERLHGTNATPLCNWCAKFVSPGQLNQEQKRQADMLSRSEAILGWKKDVEDLIRERKIAAFPFIPGEFITCRNQDCAARKQGVLGACVHDIKAFFEAGPTGADDMKKAYINFHPDRFVNCCVEQFKETGRTLSEEMFKLIGQALGK